MDQTLTDKTILVVDDDALNLKATMLMLRQLGCNVVTAVNGQEALDALESLKYCDLVFLDLNLPDFSGCEVCRRFRENEQPQQRTRIIALTAHSSISEQLACIEAGMDGFMTKPLRQHTLVDMLQE